MKSQYWLQNALMSLSFLIVLRSLYAQKYFVHRKPQDFSLRSRDAALLFDMQDTPIVLSEVAAPKMVRF